MSRDNVGVVKRAWEAWIRNDLDALMEDLDPEVEWDTTSFEGWPEDAIYYGHVGVRGFLEEWRASWDRYEAGVESYIEVGDDRVLVLCWQRGVGPGSHVPVHIDMAQVMTLQNGLIRRNENYSDQGRALEAVGLRA
jgi:ketosteroid isomerase-like protein